MQLYLLTGAAGFIGHWVAQELIRDGAEVVGIDNLNDAYDPRIKRWRLDQLVGNPNFRFVETDITNKDALDAACGMQPFNTVFHLAARAGAPQSVEHPHAYIEANVIGTQNVLDKCRELAVPKLVMASTSSLYGWAAHLPIAESADTDWPLSPYAASKKAAEALCHVHYYLYGIDVTVLRYFTVYGPAGRPDMSLFRFIRWIREGVPVVVHGDGTQSRDFTYIRDIVRGTIAAARPLGYEVINLGSNAPVPLIEALRVIEECLGLKARIEYAPVHRVDVSATWADCAKAEEFLGWRSLTSFRDGVEEMVRWYLDNRDWVRHLELP